MKPATEEFLYFLLYTADMWLRPSWRNVAGLEEFEAWAYRTGLSRRLAELERQKLIERRAEADGVPRLIRLTAAGRNVALSGVDPADLWARAWDGRWRLVLFDVSEGNSTLRKLLRRRLREQRFGCLQNSVWLSPDPLDTIRSELSGTTAKVESLAFFEGRPGGGESDQDLVEGAWNFAAIRQLYDEWSQVADAVPKIRSGSSHETVVREWAARERAAWLAIVARDPFLPEALLPRGYPGRAAWSRRIRLLTTLGKTLSGSA